MDRTRTDRQLKSIGIDGQLIFPKTYEGIFERRDGTTFPWAYIGTEAQDGVFIGIERIDVRDEVEEDRWRGQLEIRTFSVEKGRNTDIPNVTVYGPELTYGHEGPKPVKSAYLNFSTGQVTPANADIYVRLVNIARYIATQWNEVDTPKLEAKAQDEWQERLEARREAEAKRKWETHRANKLAAVATDNIRKGVPVRVRIKNKKTPVTGVLNQVPEIPRKFILTATYGKDFEVTISQIEQVEEKNLANGRFELVNF